MKTSSSILLGCLLALAPGAAAQERGAEEKLDLSGKVLIVTLQDGRAHTLRDTAVRTIGGRAFFVGMPVDMNRPTEKKEAPRVLFPVDRIQEITLFESLEALHAYYRPSRDYELRRREGEIRSLAAEILEHQENLARWKVGIADLEKSLAKAGEDRALAERLDGARSTFNSTKKKVERLLAEKAKAERELAKLHATEKPQDTPNKKGH